jgi:flavodoxin
MNPCLLYFSRTGNTQIFAEAIAEELQIPCHDITTVDPAIVNEHDIVLLGTPVNGFSPAEETVDFISRLPQNHGKPIILFCSYGLWTGRIFSKLASEAKKKGLQPILHVKKKMKRDHQWSPQDFADPIDKIGRALANL